MRFIFFLLQTVSILARLGAAFSVIHFVHGQKEPFLGCNVHLVALVWTVFWSIALMWPELKKEFLREDSLSYFTPPYQYGCEIDNGKHFDAGTWKSAHSPINPAACNSIHNPGLYGTATDLING